MINRWIVSSDRKHWEVLLPGRLVIGRWCRGAPCHLTGDKRHPVKIWRLHRTPRV